MASEEVNARRGRPFHFGDLEVEPIEKVVVRVEYVSGLIVGVALKEPVGVILRTPGRTWRVDFEDTEPATS